LGDQQSSILGFPKAQDDQSPVHHEVDETADKPKSMTSNVIEAKTNWNEGDDDYPEADRDDTTNPLELGRLDLV
jgi:hypothetical protein